MFKHGDERVIFAFASYLVCIMGNKLKDGKSGSRTSQEALAVIQGANHDTGLSHYSGINQSSWWGRMEKSGKTGEAKEISRRRNRWDLMMNCKWEVSEGEEIAKNES